MVVQAALVEAVKNQMVQVKQEHLVKDTLVVQVQKVATVVVVEEEPVVLVQAQTVVLVLQFQ
jgi:hypothetical protein